MTATARTNLMLKALLASMALALVGAASSAYAADWTGAVSKEWSNGANWSGGTPPTSADDAVVDVTSPNAPNIAGGITASTAQLYIGQSATGALIVSNGSLGTNGTLWLGYDAGASGTLSATGSGSQIGVNGNLQVGYNGTGAVSLSQGADFAGVYAFLGMNSADSKGSLTLDGAGTTFTLNNDLHVGVTGTGTLAITNGATFSGSQFHLGTNAGAVGTATVDGAGSSLTTYAFSTVGNAGKGTLNITNGGVASLGGFDVLYIGSEVTGSGVVNVDGAGSQLNANTSVGYWGTGVLNVTNGGTVDTGGGNLEIGFQSGSNGTVSVTGAGSTLNAYGVYVGYGGTGVLTVSNGGAVNATDFYVGGYSWGSLGGVGTVNIGAASGSAPVAPGQINAATVQFGDGTGELVFNHTSQNYNFAPVIAGDGEVTVEAGTTIFSAANTYTGDTTINGGTLLVNGSTNSSGIVFVNPGGTLGGTGRVGNVFVDDHATLAPGTPGNSTGMLMIDGVLMMCNCSTYAVKADNHGNADWTAVTGVANLGGALKVTPTTWIGAATTYTVLSSVGGTNGNFDAASVTRPGLARIVDWSVVGNDVLMTLDRGSMASAMPANASRNARAIGDAIDNSISAGATPDDQMIDLMGLTGTALTDAIEHVSGQPAAAGQQASYNASKQFMTAMFDPFALGRGGNTGSAAIGSAPKPAPTGRSSLGAMSVEAPRAYFLDPRWSFWGTVYGGNTSTSGSGGTGDTTSRTFGAVTGADLALTRDTTLGFALGGGSSSFAVSNGLGGGDADMFQAGVFGKHTMGAAYVFAGLSYTYQDVTTNRTVTVSGTDELEANFDANTFGGRIEAGYRYDLPFVGFIPYGAVQVTDIDLPGYEEHAVSGSSAFALSYDGNGTTITRTELGARFDRAFELNDALLTLRGRLAWAHDEGNDGTVSAAFLSLPGSAFTVNGAVPSPDLALVSAGAEMKWLNNFSIAGTFEGEFSENTTGYAGKGAVRYAW